MNCAANSNAWSFTPHRGMRDSSSISASAGSIAGGAGAADTDGAADGDDADADAVRGSWG